MKRIKTLGLGIILTVLVITSVVLAVLLFQNMDDAERLRTDVSQIRQSISAESPVTAEEEAASGLERCEGGELRYHSVYTTLTFCYPTKLGAVIEKETDVSPEAREGTKYHFTFDRDDAIRIDLQTANYRKTGDSDIPDEVSFSCIDFNKSNEELSECFFDDVVHLERMALNDKKALLATLTITGFEDPETSIEATRLIIPEILEQPKMDAIVILEPERAEDAKKILNTIQ